MAHAPARNNRSTQTRQTSRKLFDPALINAARKIYCTYCNLNTQSNKRAFWVVIDRESCKGQLIFKGNPILLPGECFIAINLIEAEVY